MNVKRFIFEKCVEMVLIAGVLDTAVGASADERLDSTLFTDTEIRTILRMSPIDGSKLGDPTNRYCADPAAKRFGKSLFFDKRLSKNNDTACGSCHKPDMSWAGGDTRVRHEKSSGRHTPALWNVGYYRWYNWDGSADSLWAQSLGPIENAHELASSRVAVARVVKQNGELREPYEAIFGPIPAIIAPERLPESGRPLPQNPSHPDHRHWSELTSEQQSAVNELFANVGKAIAAFEASIVSTNAPFDRFVEGLREGDTARMNAISLAAKRGLKLFLGKAKCRICHSGPNFSDSEFHHVFLGDEEDGDLGRWTGIERLRKSEFNFHSEFNDADPTEAVDWVSYVVRSPETKRQFKTPTLRNVMLSAPYMHTGRYETIDEVIEHYDRIDEEIDDNWHREVVLSSLHLTVQEKHDLKAFLHSLTDESFLNSLDAYAINDL